jgi:hypothetical protein
MIRARTVLACLRSATAPAPRKCNALVEVTSYRVDGKWAADGRDYHVFQHHFL